jgi:hypothetical protein
MKAHHNPGPMDAPPGLLEYAAGEDFAPAPRMVARAKDPETARLIVARVNGVLTPGEAEVAAACVAAMLEDYEKADPACPLFVWKPSDGGDVWARRMLNDSATDARVSAARSALAKLRGPVAPVWNTEKVDRIVEHRTEPPE